MQMMEAQALSLLDAVVVAVASVILTANKTAKTFARNAKA
jgi:hypothetical protein